jgi:hypothetical protein
MGAGMELAIRRGVAVFPADPVPLRAADRGWVNWLGAAISATVLVAILADLRNVGVHKLLAVVPSSGGFWAVAAAYYAAPIVCEWVIFRRLWRIPLSGVAALARKMISNEVFLGYSGEVYFYTWARKRAPMAGAPFGAIKDVTILSALVGNLATLAMMILALPVVRGLQSGLGGGLFYLSIVALGLTSLGALLFRRRLFTLPRPDLRFVATVHLARIILTTGLAALLWHMSLPDVALGWWLLLAALRLLLSRLPFLPNKDLAFAGFAVMAVGHDSQVVAMLAMVAGLLLATHILLGLLLIGAELAGVEEPA